MRARERCLHLFTFCVPGAEFFQSAETLSDAKSETAKARLFNRRARDRLPADVATSAAETPCESLAVTSAPACSNNLAAPSAKSDFDAATTCRGYGIVDVQKFACEGCALSSNSAQRSAPILTERCNGGRPSAPGATSAFVTAAAREVEPEGTAVSTAITAGACARTAVMKAVSPASLHIAREEGYAQRSSEVIKGWFAAAA